MSQQPVERGAEIVKNKYTINFSEEAIGKSAFFFVFFFKRQSQFVFSEKN